MQWKRDKWTVYVIALVITVAVMVSGQLLWQKYAMAKPLDRGLQAIQGVESARWEEAGKTGEAVVKVTLGQVDNLQKTYGEIAATAKKSLGRRAFRIELRDHRTPALEELFQNINLSVQEAIFTGNFVAMTERVKAQAGAAQADARIYVDARYVYVQLAKGSEALYAVVPRQADSQEVR
jgi:L-alanine-DL-glutamate epimerase-like enolase superfamily enzyme